MQWWQPAQWERQPALGAGIVYFSTILLFVTSNQKENIHLLHSAKACATQVCWADVHPELWDSNEPRTFVEIVMWEEAEEKWLSSFILIKCGTASKSMSTLFPALSFVLLYELLPWNNQLRPIDFNKPVQKTMTSLKILPNSSTG